MRPSVRCELWTNVVGSESFPLFLSFAHSLSRRRGQILHRRINIGGCGLRGCTSPNAYFCFSRFSLVVRFSDGITSYRYTHREKETRLLAGEPRRAAAFLSRGSLAASRKTIVKSVLRSWPRTWR